MVDAPKPYADVETSSSPVSDLTDRDLAIGLLGNLSMNCDAQLLAIHQHRKLQGVAKQQRHAAIEQNELLARAAKAPGVNEHFISEWLSELQEDTYEDAAHSMANVAMLAPLVESIFHRAFKSMGKRYVDKDLPWSLPKHSRWDKDAKHRWDCYYFGDLTDDHRGLVKGIMELAAATDLAQYLPNDIETTLTALFQYRNKMLHNSLEWPTEELFRFAGNVKGWPSGWFSSATAGGIPSFFYATDEFIDVCLKTIDGILEALGRYARNHMYS